MLRPSLLVLTPAAAAAALLGASLPGPVALPVAAAGGAVVAVGLARVAERRLQRGADRLSRLLDRLPLPVLLFAPRGMVYANPAGRAQFPAARPGRSPLRALESRVMAQAVAEARAGGRTVQIELTHGRRELQVKALVTAGGEVAVVVTDLTETRRLDAIRRDFVTNASHELKTPVAGIQALADSLELALRRDPDRARHMVGSIGEEAARLGRLVRDLLDLARLEEESAQRSARVDLAQIVAAQVAAAAPLAAERRIEVRVDCPEAVSLVAVAEDLQLITHNLLENALRYSYEGGKVHVSVHRDGEDVVLEVADTGTGISAADRERVFERFYRVDRARSRADGGTGLGLSIVRHAAERQGGSATVESVLGEGSTFRVILPVAGRSS